MTVEPKNIWDEKYKVRSMNSPLEFTKKAYEHMCQNNCESVLDIGCGDGRDSIFFSQKGLDVTAIDFSEEAIAKLRNLDSTIDAQVMDILDIDFPDASFDAIYAHLSLHYFDGQTTTDIFQNIWRMLKTDGLFFVKCKSTSDPLYGKGKKVGEDMYYHTYVRHFFSLEYMKSKLKDFEIIDIQETISTYDDKKSSFIEAVAKK